MCKILLGLLRSEWSELGYEELSVPGFRIERYLGRGGSCLALEAECESDDCAGDKVVVKLFDAEKQDALRVEQDSLVALAQADIFHVPQCRGHYEVLIDGVVSKKLALVCYPVGSPVWPVKNGLPVRGSHLADLVTILQHAHSINIVHRDVKPENIFLVNGGEILLNDWGISCAFSPAVSVPWKGTRAYSDPPDDGAMHFPSASKDLRSLVRCAYSMLFYEPEQPQDMEYWSGRLEGVWLGAMEAANTCNYAALSLFFKSLK